MTTIDQLGGTENVKDSDLIPIYQRKNRRTRNVSAIDLAEYVAQTLPPPPAPPPARELLTADRTYYVRTDGSDSNTGLSNTAGGAFLTIQRAVDAVSNLDIGVNNVTISLAPGQYNALSGVQLKSIVGGGLVTIQGAGALNTDVQVYTSGTVLPTQGVFYSFGISGRWRVTNLRVYSIATGPQSGILAGGGSGLIAGNIDYGSGLLIQIRAIDTGSILCDSAYSISSGSNQHYGVAQGGIIRAQSISVSISGNPTISAFCAATQCGVAVVSGTTFIGTTVGLKFNAVLNGVINTNGSGVDYLPGTSAGTLGTGGQYA